MPRSRSGNLPVARNYEPHNRQPPSSHPTVICLGDIDLYFSYGECVAFRFYGRLYVRSNTRGSARGKHLNWIDGGTEYAKSNRLSDDRFLETYRSLVGSRLNNVSDDTDMDDPRPLQPAGRILDRR